MNKKCRSCDRHALYGRQTDGVAIYCGAHRQPGHVNVLSKRCAAEGCCRQVRVRVWGFRGGSAWLGGCVCERKRASAVLQRAAAVRCVCVRVCVRESKHCAAQGCRGGAAGACMCVCVCVCVCVGVSGRLRLCACVGVDLWVGNLSLYPCLDPLLLDPPLT